MALVTWYTYWPASSRMGTLSSGPVSSPGLCLPYGMGHMQKSVSDSLVGGKQSGWAVARGVQAGQIAASGPMPP